MKGKDPIVEIVRRVLEDERIGWFLETANGGIPEFLREVKHLSTELIRLVFWMPKAECECALTVRLEKLMPCIGLWSELPLEQLPPEFLTRFKQVRDTLATAYHPVLVEIYGGDFASKERRLGKRVVVVNSS